MIAVELDVKSVRMGMQDFEGHFENFSLHPEMETFYDH